jgi:acetyl-CoA acyltransferase
MNRATVVSSREVAIVAGVRTPMARAVRGSLRDTRPDDLGALVVTEARRRSGTDLPVEDLVFGCANPEAEQGFNVARIIGLLAGLGEEVPAMTVNRGCSSGLQAVAILADRIRAGDIDTGIAGGVESMSRVPMDLARMSVNERLIALHPGAYVPMGNTAEIVARRFAVAREDQDAFALRSHQRAVSAWAEGRLAAEVVAVETSVQDKNAWRAVRLEHDEGPRADATLQKLAALRPAFEAGGSVTAGNSSPLTDGAAALVLMAADCARRRGVKPRALLRAFAVTGVAPEIMGVGPVPAVRKLLTKAGLTTDQIDLFEMNEAFAAQALYCIRELQLPLDRVNVNGGAIALGHPLGATGARLIVTALHELEHRQGQYAVITMCAGGGMGAAALIERFP